MADVVEKFADYYHNKGAIDAINSILAGAPLAPDMELLLDAMRRMRDKIQADQDKLVAEHRRG